MKFRDPDNYFEDRYFALIIQFIIHQITIKMNKPITDIVNLRAVNAETEPVGSNSLAFKYDEKDGKCSSLISIFEIPEESRRIFEQHFKSVATGKGQEYRNITQLNSSALLSLLCFWNVSKQTPFHYGGIDYTRVSFEKENPVFNRPSSVDIMLISEDGKHILFLESKFTEPLKTVSNMSPKAAYQKLYTTLLYDSLRIGDIYENNNKEKVFDISSFDNKPHYLDGIKQMISHIYGVINSPEYTDVEDIKIGTILYKFDDEDYPTFYNEFFSKNKDLVNQIAQFIGKHPKKLNIIAEPLTYQKAFTGKNSEILIDKIRDFYRLK